MFAEPAPRVFALPPGVDFAAELAAGLRGRLAGLPPEAMADVEIFVPTARMRAELVAALAAAGPTYLPRIVALPELAAAAGTDEPVPGGAAAGLTRMLELMRLVRGLLTARPDLGPPGAAPGLAASLAALADEMVDEGVPAAALAGLDVADHAAHWQTALAFLQIAAPWIDDAPGPARALATAVAARLADWAAASPAHPVIVAGSTGSRGTTARLMAAVAALPQGAVVLPGHDPWTDPAVAAPDAAEGLGEDHPQARLRALLDRLGLAAPRPWTAARPPDPARNRLISLALRPAPVTDRWRAEGPALGDPGAALARVSLVEAPGPRAEALAIARALAEAVAEGRTAALVTPDRTLARRVTVALDRWGLLPDDSAGRPLALTAPARFLRQIAARWAGDTGAVGLIALLKHPLAHSGAGRGPHLRQVLALELWLRRRGIPFPGADELRRFGTATPEAEPWSGWLAAWLEVPPPSGAPAAAALSALIAAAEGLAAGPGGAGSGELWQAAAGEAVRDRIAALVAAAEAVADPAPADLPALLALAFSGAELRDEGAADRRVMIWGPREVRARRADLVVLGGLTEGTWPETPPPDPWLSRPMRRAAGLRLPERATGLAAHDFQIAAAAPEVVLSRALRSTDAETVPSRWLLRLTNLTAGLPDGAAALAAARRRGQAILARALAEDADLSAVPAACAARNPRPAPAPPVAARPAELGVTEISRLIRDPYAIYARHVLGLAPLDPLTAAPDARRRGLVLHRLFEGFVADHPPGRPVDPSVLLDRARALLAEELPWVAERALWLSRLARIAPDFLAWHAGLDTRPLAVERRGTFDLPGLRLVGRADRIDRRADGTLVLLDYKTGTLPSARQQEAFDKQLIVLALMARAGAFAGLAGGEVAEALYVGIGRAFALAPAPVDAATLDEHRDRLIALAGRYRQRRQGYAARRAMARDSEASDYDGLSRLGEWALSDPAVTLVVGDDDGDSHG